MEYKNIENFKSWLIDNMKSEFDLDAVLDDVARQHGETGTTNYELASWETRSGNPECYSYDIEEDYNEEEDSYSCTFIF